MRHELKIFSHATYTSALSSCRQWGCYHTTETIASVKHIDHLNQVIKTHIQPSQETAA